MTEAEWLTCEDPAPIVEGGLGASERKLRLFAVACCESIQRMIPRAGEYAQGCYWAAIKVAERYADGMATAEELLSACSAAGDLGYGQEAPDPFQEVASLNRAYVGEVWKYALEVACQEFSPETDPDACDQSLQRERLVQVQLIREIFGNPFRPVVLDPEWLTSTVVALARDIYEKRAFDQMPILADALQDAGCDNADVLDHCRGSGPHVRGCWVVDLVLGKS